MLFRKNSIQKNTFESWIRNHKNALYRHALWMTGHREVAADMVQETFFQAWQVMHTLQETDKALPWLITILRRAIYKEQRQQYRHIETMHELGALALDSATEDSANLVEIYKLLEGLSLAHREVFLLHHLQGFSYEEISEQLDIPKGTVMSRLSRAKEKLRAVQSASNNVIQINNSAGN